MRKRELCPVPPGSGLKPIYGSGAPSVVELAMMLRARDLVARTRMERFDGISYANWLGRKMVIPMTPSAVETVVMNKDKAFANEPAWDLLIGAAFRRGILLMDFGEHRHHRLILQQAFSNNSLKGYMQEMQPMLIERIGALPTGQVRLAREFKKITLDMALEVFVGVKLPRAEADRLTQAFLDCLSGLSALIRRPVPGGKWACALRNRRVLEEFFYSQIPHKRRRETPDLFSVLCHTSSEEGAAFSDEDVVNHMIFVLFAAHDTSTTALTTMAYYLAKNPEWQHRARAESLELPPELSYDSLKTMQTQDLILKEALRLNSPVPTLARQSIKDTSIDGHYIPSGTYVMTDPKMIHLNPRYWNDPHRFDPERFAPERAEDKTHRFAWFPFGGGVHKCIGLYFAQMEIKTMMHNLLRNFEWTVPPDYTWKLDPKTLGEPVDGLLTTLTRR